MEKQAEFHAAESALLTAEVNVKSVRISLEAIDREIGILTLVQGSLIDNLNELKKEEIVPLAEVYKKAKYDLGVADARLAFLRVDRENHLKVLGRAEKTLLDARERYALALKRLKEPLNNVVQGNFGRKNGQK